MALADAATASPETNETVVRRIFDAFARRDAFALRGVFAADAVWTVPGDGAMAGAYRGPDEIFVDERVFAVLIASFAGRAGRTIEHRQDA